MFLIELTNGNLLFGMIPEPAALLILGVSMIGTAVAARRFLKQQAKTENYERMQDFTQG